MPVTQAQAHDIATLAVQCRPHGARHWDIPGVVAAISKVQHLALADVTCAAMRAASDRTIETPAPIGITTSSAWRERLSEPTPTKPVVCPVHGLSHAGQCPSCRVDQILADPDEAPRQDRPREPVDPTPGAEACRAVIRPWIEGEPS